MPRKLALILIAVLLIAQVGTGFWQATRQAANAVASAPLTVRSGTVTVHYGTPAQSATAELLARAADLKLGEWARQGLVDMEATADITLLDPKQAWPFAYPAPAYGRTFRAVSPHTVVGRTADAQGLDEAGFFGALGLAVRGGAAARYFGVDWIQEGMGQILAAGWSKFLLKQWATADQKPVAAADLFHALNDKKAAVLMKRQAAEALVSLLIDRWGVEWAAHTDKAATALTPTGALLWTTGASAEAEALSRWQNRIKAVVDTDWARLLMVNADGTPFVSTVADTSPDRLQPKLAALPKGPGPNDNYSPQDYTIAARYEPSAHKVSGDETLSWKNGEGIGIDTLYFSLYPNAEQYARNGGNIRIDQVQVDGKPVPFTARWMDLAVPLGRKVAPGESVKVHVSFVTHLPDLITVRVLGQDLSGRFNLAHWFPILAVLDDRGWNLQPLPTAMGEPYSETAAYHVTLNVPEGVQVGATGRQVSREAQGGRWVYTYEAPAVRDWVATGGTNLATFDTTAEGVAIHVLHTDPNWVGPAAYETARALSVYNQHFGPYPYQDIVVTCCAGLEYPGLFYASPQDPQEFWRVVIYHELGHQWFYSYVGNDQFGEAWLDEGFATYAEQLAVKRLGPQNQVRRMNSSPLPAPLHVSSSTRLYTLTGNGSFYGQGVYIKGALALLDLEKLLGADSFDRLMHTYVLRFGAKTATTDDFIRLASEVAGRDLTKFFADDQVYGTDREPLRPVFASY